MRKRIKKTNLKKYFIAFLVFAILVLLILVTKKYIFKTNVNLKIENIFNKEESLPDEAKLIKEKPLKIYNQNTRNVAVMISNERPAWPQAGLQNAYMIYECIIEGGETRYMALFKEDRLPNKIGPVRSSRHYFLDYLAEHDAIYAHFGWSPMAEIRIKQRGVQNINGIYDNYFWREGGGYNNAFISRKTILDFAKRKGYNLTSSPELPFKITSKNFDINGEKYCNNIRLTYSNRHYVDYVYDKENKVYLRSMRGTPHVDRVTKERIKAKNIIVMKVKNFNLNDYVGSARQDLDNIGSGSGYYITNGKYEEITWNKPSYSSKTKIRNLNNEEITLNDGLTFIQVVPDRYNVKIN